MARTSNEHDELRDQIELYVLDALTASERRGFEGHLTTCGECQSEVKSLRSVVDSLGQAVPQHFPPAALRSRVLAATGVPAPDAPARSPRATVAPRPAPWLAAAAMLVITTGAAVYATTLRSRIVVLERRLAEASQRAQMRDQQLAELQRAATVAQTRLAVLAAPDLRRIDLAGQSVAPQSAGRVFWSRSQGLLFTASNLPPLPAGRTYQLWVLTRQPAPVSAGVFKPDTAGRAAEMFATRADLPEPTGIAVTIEPDGGVAAPTGDKYLVGL